MTPIKGAGTNRREKRTGDTGVFMPEDQKEWTFEESLKRLETIIAQLESGRGDLETSLARYEEGVRLLHHCHRTLKAAEQKIEILKNFDESGEAVTESIDPDSFRSDESTPGRQNSPSVTQTTSSEDHRPSSPSARTRRPRSTGSRKSDVSKKGDALAGTPSGSETDPESSSGNPSDNVSPPSVNPDSNPSSGMAAPWESPVEPGPESSGSGLFDFGDQ